MNPSAQIYDPNESFNLDDRTALRLYVQRSDAHAFDVLAKRYQLMVLATCRRILRNETDAEDAAQETFLKFARNAGAIKSNIGAWLHAAAMGTSIDLIRRSESRRRVERRTAKHDSHSESGSEHMLWREIEPMLDEAIANLDEADRDLIIARFLCNRSQRDIALEAGVSDGTIHRRTKRALIKLQNQLTARGLCIAGTTTLTSAIAYAAVNLPNSALTSSISKIGLVGLTQNATKGVVVHKFVTLAAVVASIAVISVGIGLLATSYNGSTGINQQNQAPVMIADRVDYDAPDRPSGRLGPFEIISAGERSFFDRGVGISSRRVVINHGLDPDSGEVKQAQLRIIRVSEEDEKTVIETKVETITPLGDRFSRFKLGQFVDIQVEFDSSDRLVLMPLTDGVQLGRNEPKWFGVRPPIGWNEHALIPDDAGPYGMNGPWTEAERIPVTITNREIRFGASSWSAAEYRIVEWTKMDSFSRVLSIHAGGRDPRLIGTKFRLLLRKDETGYSVAYFPIGEKQADRWPSSFEYSKDNPVHVVTISEDG
jgi:RNA polymerase sigma factor (sigma-70 family)